MTTTIILVTEMTSGKTYSIEGLHPHFLDCELLLLLFSAVPNYRESHEGNRGGHQKDDETAPKIQRICKKKVLN